MKLIDVPYGTPFTITSVADSPTCPIYFRPLVDGTKIGEIHTHTPFSCVVCCISDPHHSITTLRKDAIVSLIERTV